MAIATLTSKGQITIPVEVRKRLGLKAGDRVDFLIEEDGEIRLKAKKRPLADLLGALRATTTCRLTLSQMQEAVEDAAAEDWNRVRSQRD